MVYLKLEKLKLGQGIEINFCFLIFFNQSRITLWFELQLKGWRILRGVLFWKQRERNMEYLGEVKTTPVQEQKAK